METRFSQIQSHIYMHTCTLTLVEEQLNDDIILPEGRLGKTNLDSTFMPH